MTPEESLMKGQVGAKSLFLKLAMLEISDQAVKPFVELAASLGLTERTVPPEEEKRLFFEFVSLGISVMDVQSRKHLMTDSVFSPKFDPQLHERFMAGMYRNAAQQLDAHGISQLRELRPQGKRTAETLQYRQGKPLSGSQLEERCTVYVRQMMKAVERGEEDFAAGAEQEFVFNLTELIDARLANRLGPVVTHLQPVARQIAALAIDIVDKEVFAE